MEAGAQPHSNGNQSSRDVTGTVEQLRQTQCSRTRTRAIVTFCKGLRRGPLFQSFWNGVGGAAGLANLMAQFSLRDVRALCRHLGATASAQNARPERKAGLAELVRLLHEDGPVKMDPRPLRQYYRDILPACDLDLVLKWDENCRTEWSKFQRVVLSTSHRGWYQKRFLNDLCSPVAASQRMSFSAERRLFQGDLAFSEITLSTLIANEETISYVPDDFLADFALPMLRRLVRRQKYDDETRDKFLNLVVQCIGSHAEVFESHSIEDREELIRYTIQRWSAVRVRGVYTDTNATRERTDLCLAQMVKLMSSSCQLLGSLENIFNGLLRDRKSHVDSYHLLRLILQHARGYELDIDDDSPRALSRLSDLTEQGKRWPMELFLYLDTDNAIGLFERLSAADPTSSFLTVGVRSRSSLSTVLQQNQHPGSSHGDAEIVRYLLLAKSSNKETDDSAGVARARTLIYERRKKSEEGREWQQREYWARSAVNLCVAAGDMEMLDGTILWARRFTNQPLVGRGLYNRSTFGTEEIRELLSAAPGKYKDGEDSPSDRATVVAGAIEVSNRILVHLAETIKMSMSQPQADNKHWQTLLDLPKIVVDCRLKKENAAAFNALFDPAALGVGGGAVEMVWKPTIDTLLMAERLLSTISNLPVQATGSYVIQSLPGTSGKARAELISFLIQRMKMYLGPEGFPLQMHKVVDLVTGVASSDQPWLAIPFVRDLILDGEGADSVWHRNLLSVSFLSSLPVKAVRDLLHSLADAIREKMREQNARPREDQGDADRKAATPRPPVVKVTTVKMVARLLQDNQLIGESAACDLLLGLLVEARHIDNLVAIVNSLLSILERPAYSPGIHSRILDALEEKLSPILPQLNQRRPLNEADWVDIESGQAELPDVAHEKPLLSLIYYRSYDSKVMSREVRARLIELLVHVPAQSALQNERFHKAFLARNGFSLDEGENLPAAPACLTDSVNILSRFTAYVPASTVIAVRDLALANLDPTPGIVRVTEAVKADRDLVNSNAGRHWLAQFDNPGPRAIARLGVFSIAGLLQKDSREFPTSKRDDGKGITVQLLQGSVLAVADRIIACQIPEALKNLVVRLCSGRFSSRATWLAWRKHCVPVLETMAAKVDGLRRRQPGEAPVLGVMPNLFLLRAMMLPIPYSEPPKEPAPAQEVDVFVAELSRLLEWLVQRGLPYHDEFTNLKKQVHSELHHGDYARVALRLGVLDDGVQDEGMKGDQLVGYLRLELSGHLLVEADRSMDEGGGVLPEVKKMVRSWVDSDDEFARLTGISVITKHKALYP